MSERELELPRSGRPPLRVVLRGEEASRLALVMPGARYTPAHPLLYHCSAALLAEGFAVAELWWEEPPGQAGMGGVEALRERLADDARAAVAATGGEVSQALLVGKSLGTLAMAGLVLAGDGAGARGVWLTPLLGEPAVAEAIVRAGPRAQLVLGSADPARNAEALERARQAGARVLEIPGADHGLELPDPLASIDALREAIAAVQDFARAG